MNGKSFKVPIGGQMVEGEEVQVKKADEQWNTYELEDNTILKIKIVLTRVVRTTIFNAEKDPVYYITSQNILQATVPPELKKLDE